MDGQRDARERTRRGKAPPTNLPVIRDRLIGRERELALARDVLLREDVGLLTLTGAGGSGKTRLAIELARSALDEFDDGAYLVALAPLQDPVLVAATVAGALGLQDFGGRPPEAVLCDFLRPRRLLLVLDNLEHLTDAAPLVAELLAAAPGLAVLATSRAPLHLHAEHQLPVGPLALPDLRRLPPPAELARYGAVALFLRRAAAIRPDLRLTAENAAAVAEICHRLDGLPLAIELAAARIQALSPAALVKRLERGLPLLTGGARDLPERQRTLRATIDWSHDLLDAGQRRVFRRLGVFVGGCNLDAAQAVCAGDGEPESDLLDIIGALVDRNLVWADDRGDDEARFGMLETIREYALEQLEASGEASDARRRHTAYYLGFAEAAAEKVLTSPDRGAWLDRLGRDQDNLRAAVAWSRADDGEDETELRLAGALFWPWRLRGQPGEARDWLEHALARTASSPATPARAKALHGAGVLAWLQGDYATARPRLEATVATWRAVDERRGLAYSLTWLGLVARSQGDYAARGLQEESVAIFRQLGDRWGLAYALHFLGGGADALSDPAASRARLEESVAIFRDLGDRWGYARPLRTLGVMDHQQGEPERARARLEEALTIFRDTGDTWNIAGTLKDLVDVARRGGDRSRAAALYGESLALFHELGDRQAIAGCLEGLGAASAERQPERAARLFGAAEALRQAAGAPLDAVDRADLDGAISVARAQLTEEPFTAAWRAGWAMPPDEVIRYALAEVGPRSAAVGESGGTSASAGRPRSPPASARWRPWSPAG